MNSSMLVFSGVGVLASNSFETSVSWGFLINDDICKVKVSL